ncbi:hypothetical protein NEUTE1DRAFT_106885 [Neurospora tetrasperma FGSC 2508]|uniref:Uncharacterized protein n=1 Tax=Neurospora tetrasperma (strain FGSC 2508 / ATCC MYA-4615 / P0657) TaxID=510951 RepID=F8MB67_NEUT8|nr:uncharacterized protein NEUTE1DRAFT_106885 [Neurospora tetrasperma FGSC 2508]EGO60232.1 hypothetical protein NEUTE1DRAFT_106885 [Neurospora tetrasperma FGSC 2508]EGZ75806.1 hypothetical protein NEUTE2DRAFT_136882 [Neurospora tetrasperma FGSC 2509]
MALVSSCLVSLGLITDPSMVFFARSFSCCTGITGWSIVPLRRWSSSRFSNRGGGSYSTKKKKKEREQWKERSHGVGTDRMETAWNYWHGVSLGEEQPETARQRDGHEDLSQGSNSPSTKKKTRFRRDLTKHPAQCPQQQQQCLSTRPAVGSVHGARRYLYTGSSAAMPTGPPRHCPRTKSSFDAETVFEASDGATGQCYRTWLFNHDHGPSLANGGMEWGRTTVGQVGVCLHMRAYSNTKECTDHIRCKKQCYCRLPPSVVCDDHHLDEHKYNRETEQ